MIKENLNEKEKAELRNALIRIIANSAKMISQLDIEIKFTTLSPYAKEREYFYPEVFSLVYDKTLLRDAIEEDLRLLKKTNALYVVQDFVHLSNLINELELRLKDRERLAKQILASNKSVSDFSSYRDYANRASMATKGIIRYAYKAMGELIEREALS